MATENARPAMARDNLQVMILARSAAATENAPAATAPVLKDKKTKVRHKAGLFYYIKKQREKTLCLLKNTNLFDILLSFFQSFCFKH